MSKPNTPKISICIVTYNNIKLLEKCLNSITEHTEFPNYRILVYSNGCNDGTKEYLIAKLKEKENKVIPIFSDVNNVYVKPNNEMLRLFPNDDVVLVNNDVTVTKGWLSSLNKEAYKFKKVGIVGPKILYPDGKLQEFGSELYKSGMGINIGKNDDPFKDTYMETKRAGYVSGCCMYIKRIIINTIGVFDSQFHPCYCEDSDYCYTAWNANIETIVTPKSIVYHIEGATSGKIVDKGYKSFQKINYKKFVEKHGDLIDEVNFKVRKLNI